MKKRQLIGTFAALCLMLGLTACGGGSSAPEEEDPIIPIVVETPQPQAPEAAGAQVCAGVFARSDGSWETTVDIQETAEGLTLILDYPGHYGSMSPCTLTSDGADGYLYRGEAVGLGENQATGETVYTHYTVRLGADRVEIRCAEYEDQSADLFRVK